MSASDPRWSRSGRGAAAVVLAVLLFLPLYLETAWRADGVFDKNANALFEADTGDWALLIQEPFLASPPGDAPPDADFTSERRTRRRLARKLDATGRRLNKIRKHLVTAPVSHLLYRAARGVSKPLAGEWTVRHERRALVFPSALLGSLSVAFFFLLLVRLTGDPLQSALFALLFGTAMGTWFFSSVPESYALQIFLTVLLLGRIFAAERFDLREALVLGGMTGLAALAGLNNALLLAPVFALFLQARRPVQGALAAAAAALVVVAAYGAASLLWDPRLSLADSLSFAGAQTAEYAGSGAHRLSAAGKLLLTGVNFFFFSLGMPGMPVEHPHGAPAFAHYFDSLASGTFLALYLVFLVLVLRRAATPCPDRGRAARRAVLFGLALQFAFYALVNARQSFLYTGLVLPPLLALFASRFAGDGAAGRFDSPRVRRAVLGALAVAVAVNNGLFVTRFLW